MLVKPRVRAFVCVTAHPDGCAAHVREQIRFVESRKPFHHGPKRVLVVGASTGYGLATRIVAGFGCNADTVGVFYERPSNNGKTASAGWYNTVAFEQEAAKAGIGAWSINGDAFSREIKQEAIDRIRKHLGQVDCVIYSLASPRRTDPVTGEVFKSALKPIGAPYSNKYLDTDKKEVAIATLEAATEAEIRETVKVMGGEDWQLWIDALHEGNLLAPGFRTIAYDYIGPDITWPVYFNGTIGRAKEHLRKTALELDQNLKAIGGRAIVSVNKAVVTQASSAIPGVNLYITLLFKVMKEKGLHEGCIEQIARLFQEKLYTGGDIPTDEESLIRMDDLEMREDVQAAVRKVWDKVDSANLSEYADFDGYQKEFLKLFGFGLPEVDYKLEVEIERDIPSIEASPI